MCLFWFIWIVFFFCGFIFCLFALVRWHSFAFDHGQSARSICMYLYRFFNLYLYLYLSLYLVVLSSKYSNTSATFAHLNRSTDVDHVRWTCGRVSAPLSLNGNSLNFSRRQRVGVKFNANVLEPLLCSSVLKLGKKFQKIYNMHIYV